MPLITNEDGTFLDQEGTIWDFKESWPFSYSDAYFSGLCRLVCAFANTEGGVIIFGVHDKSRKGGLNKVRPNLDKFEQAFASITGKRPSLELRRYESEATGPVEVLLIRRRQTSERPFRFLQDQHGYSKNVIFVRSGSEVNSATSNDIASLFLRSSTDEILDPPKGHLPPSPATVREFVGRMDAIDRVFHWLSQADEPRAFLFGKGGSGKSTIAYQVFRSIKSSGNGFCVAGERLERLIFVSAKARFLDVEKQESARFLGLDFKNERELYQALLMLGDADFDHTKANELQYLKDCIRDFLDQNSCFIVIDDIDTLSTAGEETGMDFLLGALWRAKKPSKILYTLRNRPTQSLSSSLEIPGMQGDEFNRFVEVCAQQFRVPPPRAEARDKVILPISEGRPLVIESIIALRRTAGTYGDAVKLFESEAGNDVRDYVFRREWDALDRTDRGREVLAILALYDKAISVEDIVTISRIDASKVKDALAAVQEIFLTSETIGEETFYSIGPLTQKFVLSASEKLDLFETIRSRVKNFKHTFYAESPALNRFVQRFNRSSATAANGESSYLKNLVREMDDEKSPQLTEDPRFLSLRATARLTLDRRDLSKARSDFQTAMDFRFSPEQDQIMLWTQAEKLGDSGESMTSEILSRVTESKGYDQAFKARLMFDIASYLYSKGKSSIGVEPHAALDILRRALELHLKAFRALDEADSPILSRSFEYCRNTCFTLGNHLNNSSDFDQFFVIISNYSKNSKVYIDPIAEPMISITREALSRSFKQRDVLQRRLNRFEKVVTDMVKLDVWKDRKTASVLTEAVADFKARSKSIR